MPGKRTYGFRMRARQLNHYATNERKNFYAIIRFVQLKKWHPSTHCWYEGKGNPTHASFSGIYTHFFCIHELIEIIYHQPRAWAKFPLFPY